MSGLIGTDSAEEEDKGVETGTKRQQERDGREISAA
jgi:hypothetical protein